MINNESFDITLPVLQLDFGGVFSSWVDLVICL